MPQASEQEMKLRRDALRREWREVRERRLTLKKLLADRGLGDSAVRGSAEYRGLVKKQHGLSMLIKHIERVLNRKAAYHAKEKSK